MTVHTPMHKPGFTKIGGKRIELRVEAELAASVLRAFTGLTPKDAEVDALPIPEKPFWLHICIHLLRFYRRVRPDSIGRRCVFDPSCSHYAELSFRRLGLLRGAVATLKRLKRCRPGSGGMDEP